MIAHLVVPYEDYDTGHGSRGRRLGMRRWGDDVAVAKGYWSEAEVDGNQAIVRLRAPRQLVDRITAEEGWRQVDRPGALWTPTRAKPLADAGFDRLTRQRTRTLGSLQRDVRDDEQHDEHRREVDAIIELIERDGYHRLARATWAEEARLLHTLAHRGYGLDRVSTGTFPTQGVLDTFTGTNGASPPNASWTNGINGSGLLEIQSNMCESADVANSYASGYYNVADYGPASECYCTIGSYSGENDRVGVACRLAGGVGSSTVDGYAVILDTVLAGTDTVDVMRIDNGAWTNLGATISQEMAVNEKLGIEANGSTITAYRFASGAWASLGSRTDATYSAAGKIGLYTRSANGQMRMDDFGGGTIGAGGGGGGGTAGPLNVLLLRAG